MKIALVIFRADSSRGGAERYTLDLAAALARDGFDVSLLASEFQEQVPGRRVLLDARAYTRLGAYHKFLGALDTHLSTNQYDVIHAMLPVQRCDLYHPHAGLAIETINQSNWINRLNLKRREFAAVEKQLLEATDGPAVLCLSKYIRDAVVRNYRLPESRLINLFNAVDLAKFDPAARPDAGAEVRKRLGIAADRIVALIIAQDFARKGLSPAIAALVGSDPRLMLLVVGQEKPSRYVRIATAQGVIDRVMFAGPTPDPYGFYKAADFFVLPTSHDPCSLVVLEALAMGVPVISTVFNGACDIMTSGVQGIVLNRADDLPALKAAYQQLCDEATRQRMREACPQLRPELSQEHHLAELKRIYSRVTRKPSGTAL